MSKPNPAPATPSRRQILQNTVKVAGAAAFTAATVTPAYAASSDQVSVALVGCGGRGGGAAMNALNTKSGPIKLVAMADAYEHRLKSSHASLSKQKPEQVDVPDDRKFIGFDAYKQAIDCLKPGDVVIMATPLAFRWVHYGYAIEKGLNVFMEKPVTADGPTSRRMLELNKKAEEKNLKVGVGLMSRHAVNLKELQKRIQDGEIGDIIAMRGYRMHGPVGHVPSFPKPANLSELDYQIQRFHSLLWASGGLFNDFYIHIIDHLCWMKNAWPVKAMGLGGRHYQSKDKLPYVDQNFDSYAVEYTFEDGAKLFFDGRTMTNAQTVYHSFLHGTKGCAIASKQGDCGLPSSIYKGQLPSKDNRLWQSTDSSNPYQNEWEVLIEAIRQDKKHNEVKRGVEASVVCNMGRASAHIGKEVTFDEMMNSEHEFAPGIDKLTKDSPAPVMPDKDGRYPQPQPGIKKTEY